MRKLIAIVALLCGVASAYAADDPYVSKEWCYKDDLVLVSEKRTIEFRLVRILPADEEAGRPEYSSMYESADGKETAGMSEGVVMWGELEIPPCP